MIDPRPGLCSHELCTNGRGHLIPPPSGRLVLMAKEKEWLSYAEQVRLLRQRGLHIEDPQRCEQILSQVNLYRLSSYFRYWQTDPHQRDSRFIEGATFDRIWDLYRSEEQLKAACMPLLLALEVMVRTRFAYHYAELVGSTRSLAEGKGLTFPSDQNVASDPDETLAHAMRTLERRRELHIVHFRDPNITDESDPPDPYAHTPIWAAVETLTFGSLSKLIEASRESGVLDAMAHSMRVSRRDLPSQIKSFVYLRNRIAHCSKLWNHAVLDKPALQKAQTRRAQRVTEFDDLSIYKIMLAMDAMAKKTHIASDWLEQSITPLLEQSPLLEAGITTPKKYGEMPTEILVS